MASAMYNIVDNLPDLWIFSAICFFVIALTILFTLFNAESKKKDDEVKKLVKEREKLAKKLLNRR